MYKMVNQYSNKYHFNCYFLNIKFVMLFLISLVGCAPKSLVFADKPDLIIERVSIDEEFVVGDESGKSLNFDFKYWIPSVTIKNIGGKAFNSPLYIAYTTSMEDLKLNYYHNFQLLEPDPFILNPSEKAIVVLKHIKVDKKLSKIKLQINYHSDSEKISYEGDYFNNRYPD